MTKYAARAIAVAAAILLIVMIAAQIGPPQ